jgi:lysophospholipase L1-like esterase
MGSILDPKPLTVAAANASYAPKWKPNTAYLAGDSVLSPTGEPVTALANFTSGATFDITNWNVPYSPKINLGTVMMMGDSIVKGIEGNTDPTTKGLCPRTKAYIESFLPGLTATIINEGVGGQTSAQFLSRLPAALAADKPRFVYLSASTNDLQTAFNVTTAAAMDNMRKMVSWVRFYGAIPIIGTTGPLNPGQWLDQRGTEYTYASAKQAIANNAALRSLAAELRVGLADVEAAFGGTLDGLYDGVHPNDSGADRWAQVVARAIADQAYVSVASASPWTGSVTDNFDRADSATTLGSAQTGQVWTASRGTWGITGNAAYSATAVDDDLASIETTWTNHRVTVNIPVPSGVSAASPGITARFADTNNHYMAVMGFLSGGTAPTVKLYKKVAGGYTQLGTTVTLPNQTGTAKFALSAFGTTITVFVNDVAVIRKIDGALTAGTKVGLRQGGVTACRWNDLSADKELRLDVNDLFERADSTTSVGTADTGQSWVSVKGTHGITGGAAYSVTNADDDMLLVDSGRVDHLVTAEFGSGDVNPWSGGVILRATADGSSLYLATMAKDTGIVKIQKKVNGTFTVLGTVTIGALSSDFVKFSAKGSTISVSIGSGAAVLTVIDSALASNTYVGIRQTATFKTRLKSFSAVAS